MSGTMTLLSIAGNVALLLWGMHMVHSGVLRAFGASLRQVLGIGLKSRWKAFLAGLGVTALLQSSTATGMMATSFIASGLMGLVPALAVMLGANIGTTLIVQLLTFNVAAVAPIFVLAGLVAFRHGGKTRTRDLGRVGIGLGLILLALHLILATIEPVEQGRLLRDLFATLAGAPVLMVALAALLTWAAYSSVAVVLLVMSLASAHVVAPVAALALVLGANLGTVIPQYLAAGSSNAARRLALGNLIVRGFGCLVAIPLLPAAAAPVDPGKPLYIDAAALATPAIALANTAREVLRMVDMVEAMLQNFLAALRDDDRKQLAEIGRTDDTLDRLHHAVKQHLTEVSREDGLDESESRRCADILAFAINLEHIGDILDNSLREIAAKKVKHRLSFSAEGFAEIAEMHRRLIEDLHLAVSVFMTGDARAARNLVDEKVAMRDLERAATENHLARLREGRRETVETSALHLDILRDLKRIASHLAAVAYPILDQNGALRRSRLLDEEASPVQPASDAILRPTR